MFWRCAMVLMCVGLLASEEVNAQTSLAATVDSDTVVVGDIFHYMLEVRADKPGRLPDPVFPIFQGFKHLGQSESRSSSVQIINGTMRQSLIVTYQVKLRAEKEGTFILLPAKMTQGGQTIHSNSIKVVVSALQTESVTAGGVKTKESFISAYTGNQQIDQRLKGRLFLYTEVDQKTLVPYQSTIARTYICKDPNAIKRERYNFQRDQSTSPEYLKIDIWRPKQSLKWKPFQFGSFQYQRALVEVVAVVPTKTGAFTFQGSSLEAELPLQRNRSRRKTRDPFNDPLFSIWGRHTRAKMPASPVSLTVLPLPQPQPDQFGGIVGSFGVKAKADRVEVTQGDLVTLRLTFEGEGYVDAIPAPKLPEMDGFQIWKEPTVQTNNQTDRRGVRGSRTFEYLLTAERSGNYTIPKMVFSLFDPKKKRYMDRATRPIQIQISPSDQSGEMVLVKPPESKDSTGAMGILGYDIQHIHTENWKPSRGVIAGIHTVPSWWILQLFPPLLLTGALWYRKRRVFCESHPELLRHGRAAGIADRRLRQAKKRLQAQDSDRFYSEVALAVRGYLGDKLGREPAGLTRDEILRAFQERRVEESEDLARQVDCLLDHCDTARYAPRSGATEACQTTFEEATQILKRLRQVWS